MFWAKSMPRETIKEHTDKLIDEFHSLMKYYGHCFTDREKELILLDCEKHDLGKINVIFQEIIDGDDTHRNLQIPHGFLSGAFWDLEDLQSRRCV